MGIITKLNKLSLYFVVYSNLSLLSMKKHFTKIVLVLLTIPFISFAQLPIIKAEGGTNRNINWPKIKKEAGTDGPGYFYTDCDQETQPYKASSTLAGQGKKSYGVKNLGDGNPMSAWVEGKPDYGIGESFEIKAAAVNVIYNGYQSTPNNWLENSRVKRFKVYKNNKPLCFLDLKDGMEEQHFELPGHENYNLLNPHIFKFEIVDVYKGSKWPDVAISEVGFRGCCFIESTLIENATDATSISSLKAGDTISGLDLSSGKIQSTIIQKTTKQTHLSVLSVETANKKIVITPDHPLYIKDFGFSSISRYMQTKKILTYEELIGKIELMVLNEHTNQVEYEKVSGLELSKGVFETYSILNLSEGKTFIANGFVTKVY